MLRGLIHSTGSRNTSPERTAHRYRATRGLNIVAARLGVVFGRWEYDTSIRATLSIPLALPQLAEEGGHAAVARTLREDWLYASDVADAVIRLMNAPSAPQQLLAWPRSCGNLVPN